MKLSSHKPIALFAFVALMATPPAAIHHSKIYRGIASEAVVQDVELDEKIPLPELPALSSSDIKVSKQVVKELDADDLKIEPVKLPELTEIKVAEPETRGLDVKVEELPKVKLPELQHGDINVSHPRFDKLAEKVTEKKANEDLELSVKSFKEKSQKLESDIARFKDDKSEKKSEKIEELAINLLLIEGSLKDLKEKKVLSEKEQKAASLIIYDAKNELEFALMDKEKPVKASEEKIAKSEASEKKEEVKKEESSQKKDKSELSCDANDKISLLTKQVQKLMEEQNEITKSLLTTTQLMLANMLKQQQQPQQPVPYQYPNQYAYQYQQPQTAGNWVYYPQGFQPSQNNIFSSPQLTQYQGGFYPDQAHQQSSWGMQPTMNFNQQMQAPQAPMNFNTSSMVTPGTFGGNGMSFNMSNPGPKV